MKKESALFSNECYLTSCPKYGSNECKENHYCQKLHRLDTLYNLALIPERQRTPLKWKNGGTADDNKDIKGGYATLSDYRKSIQTHIDNGDNLYIHSQICGNGKTEWALYILRTYLGSQWHKSDFKCIGLYVHVPRFLLALKEDISTPNEYARYVKENINSADIVVFDEIGTKGLTAFEHEQLLTIINTRIDEGKSSIFTSNLSQEDLANCVGDRLASRITGLSTDVELFGSDKRKLNTRGNK